MGNLRIRPRIYRDLWLLITSLALSVIWGVNVYRAATQSLCHDEARTWESYLHHPIDPYTGDLTAYTYFWTNHHILYTLLATGVTQAFGNSELAIRAVSVLAGAFYFWGVLALSRRLLGPGAGSAATGAAGGA